MPLQQTTGNVTTDAYGGGVAAVPNYIEDVFSTWLYAGTGASQTITNGIDLSTKGGMTWFKGRDVAAQGQIYDSNRGVTKYLLTSLTNAEGTSGAGERLTAYNSNGFSLGTDPGSGINASPYNYVSWTFRKQPKFFDVVTFTGTGASSQTISHSLASVPGFIAIKRTDSTGDWVVIARSSSNGQYYCLQNATTPFGFNSTNAAYGTVDFAGMGYLSSTTFLPYVFGGGNSSSSGTNISGATYVAYLFAHNAGGFGLTGTDNVISCGSYTGNGTTVGPDVNLGYEPQFLMVKNTSAVGSWFMWDSMRGITADGSVQNLTANSANAENTSTSAMSINATGFSPRSIVFSGSGSTYIYIAIRRGPMKVPTSGTSVFSPTLATFSGSTVTNTGFVTDMVINKNGVATTSNNFVLDRLRGSNNSTGQITLPSTSSTAAEVASSGRVAFTGSVTIQNGYLEQDTTANNIVWAFGRAPSFFDEVCSTGDGVGTALNHNLTVVPELYIQKRRDIAGQNWFVWAPGGNQLKLNLTDAGTTPGFTIGTSTTFNPISYASGGTYVNYLFATCAGVSKVGSYTGNGSSQTINCGFTGGARFVLIKRTDSTGNWYVYDTARGMTTLTDPYLLLNSTAAETATLGSVTSVSTGFAVNASILAAINTNAASYIFLAVA